MNFINKIIVIFNRAKQFVTADVWSMRLNDYPQHIATMLKYLRVVLVSFRRFNEDRVQLRASSLTYYSLLALVPILAMGFGIAKGFGFDKDLEQKLVDNFMGQEEVLNWIISFAHNMLNNTSGGVITGVGLAVLFWSVMKMMGNIESSFNDIWEVKKNRSYIRKFTDYLSIMLIAPIFIILAGSGSVYVATQLNNISSSIDVVNLSPVVIFLMKLFPYLMTWLLFTIIYIIMPNTKVGFSSALIAGILAGTAFLVVQWFYIVAQMGMSRYNVIYGSFAALPLLLFWLRASWVIVLLGAEVSFANQNIDQYELENESLQISAYAHRAFNILLLENIVRRFAEGKTPLTSQELSKQMKLPIRLVSQVIADLLAGELILEVCTSNDKVRAYSPAKDVNQYTVKYVVETLDKDGNNGILKTPAVNLNKVLKIQENFLQAIDNAPDNILIQKLKDYA
jgi:membrane protein